MAFHCCILIYGCKDLIKRLLSEAINFILFKLAAMSLSWILLSLLGNIRFQIDKQDHNSSKKYCKQNGSLDSVLVFLGIGNL